MMGEVVVREAELRSVPGLVYFTTDKWGALNSGLHALFRFENSYGASVLLGPGSYGVELAVMVYSEDAPVDGDPVDNHRGYTSFAQIDDPLVGEDGIAGYLTEESLKGLLEKIRSLPSPYLKELDS